LSLSLAVALPYHRRLRRTPLHIADTFKRHCPSPPLNADTYCCQSPPPPPQFDCCVSLCPPRLAFLHCRRHWKTLPPSNAPTHCLVLHHTVTHSQLHSTSENVGMMWGFLKRNPTRCRRNRWGRRWHTRCGSSPRCPRRAIAGCGDAPPPPRRGLTRGGGPLRPPRSRLGSQWLHICRGYS
jgi:hypothetical protein